MIFNDGYYVIDTNLADIMWAIGEFEILEANENINIYKTNSGGKVYVRCSLDYIEIDGKYSSTNNKTIVHTLYEYAAYDNSSWDYDCSFYQYKDCVDDVTYITRYESEFIKPNIQFNEVECKLYVKTNYSSIEELKTEEFNVYSFYKSLEKQREE